MWVSIFSFFLFSFFTDNLEQTGSEKHVATTLGFIFDPKKIFVPASTPGHVFIRCPSLPILWNAIRHTTGVVHARWPARVQDDKAGFLDPARQFHKGMWVRLLTGSGHRGSFGWIVQSGGDGKWSVIVLRRLRNPRVGRKRKVASGETIAVPIAPSHPKPASPVFQVNIGPRFLEAVKPSFDIAVAFFSRGIIPPSALRATIPLEHGDRVSIVSGSQTGLWGTVTAFPGNAVQVRPSDLGDTPEFLASPDQLERKFIRGDHVEVFTGVHKGRTGWVMDSADGIVTVSNPPDEEVSPKYFQKSNLFSFFIFQVSSVYTDAQSNTA
jgi:hypothetical protein